jgi:hypothetical protein
VRPIIMDALIIVLLPFVVFIAGARLMAAWTGRTHVTARLQQHAASEDRTPLNQRLRYDTAAVARHWGAFDRDAVAAERQFLELDLVFPLFYGAAFAVSLLLGAGLVAPSASRVWFIALVAVVVVSDWTENLLQIGQLQRFVDGGAGALQERWIQVASAATAIKLVSFGGAMVVCIGLAATALIRLAR